MQNEILRFLGEHPEFVFFIPMLAVCYLAWFLVGRHIPFLMQREDSHRKEVIEALKEVRDAMKGVNETLQFGLTGVQRRESKVRRKRKDPEPPT